MTSTTQLLNNEVADEPARDTAAVTVGAVLEACGIQHAIGVPDSQLRDVFEYLEPRMPVELVLREDVAVSMAVGSELAGKPTAVLMKNAGLGTSLDAIISLGLATATPLLMVLGWSGSGSDVLPHHVVMGVRTEAILEAAGVEPVMVSRKFANDDDALIAFCRRNRSQGRSTALLVQP